MRFRERVFTFQTALHVIEFIALFLLLLSWRNIIPDEARYESMVFRPVPDAAEYAYVAYAFTLGKSPLLPIANELHPSRYSPVHPFLMSVFLRLSGRALEQIFSYPLYAVVTGAILFYLWMVVGRMGLLWRLMTIFFILYTPLFQRVASSIMQESTLFFLFSVTNLALIVGIFSFLKVGNDKAGAQMPARSLFREWMGYLLLFISGFCAGALSCMRPTIFPIIIFDVGLLLWVFPGRQFFKPAAFFLLGSFACAGVIIIYMFRVAGLIDITAYRHWGAGGLRRLFGFRYVMSPPVNGRSSLSNWLVYLQAISGHTRDMLLWGKNAAISLFVAGLLGAGILTREGLWRKKAMGAEQKGVDLPGVNFYVFYRHCVILFLFALSQYLIHIFYFYHDVRFLVLLLPSCAVFGMAGCEIITRHLWRGMKKKGLVVVLVALLTINFFNIPSFPDVLRRLELSDTGGDIRQYFWKDAAVHNTNKRIAKSLNCPIFVDRLPVVNARLLLELMDYPYPIAPLVRENDLQWDGHTVQFGAYSIGQPRGYINPASLWKDNPYYSFLYDPYTQTFKGEFLDSLVNYYGRIALYYPLWREKALAPVINDITARGYSQKNISISREIRIIVVGENSGQKI